jgi:hypothetical protein
MDFLTEVLLSRSKTTLLWCKSAETDDQKLYRLRKEMTGQFNDYSVVGGIFFLRESQCWIEMKMLQAFVVERSGSSRVLCLR